MSAPSGPYNTSYRNLRNHLKLAGLDPLLSTEEPSSNPIIPAALSAAAASVEHHPTGSVSSTSTVASPNCWASLCDVSACLEAAPTNSSPSGYAVDALDDACPLLPPLPSTARLLPYENFRPTTIPFKAEAVPFDVSHSPGTLLFSTSTNAVLCFASFDSLFFLSLSSAMCYTRTVGVFGEPEAAQGVAGSHQGTGGLCADHQRERALPHWGNEPGGAQAQASSRQRRHLQEIHGTLLHSYLLSTPYVFTALPTFFCCNCSLRNGWFPLAMRNRSSI